MKKLTALLLLCSLADPTAALDRKPRTLRSSAEFIDPADGPADAQPEETARYPLSEQTAVSGADFGPETEVQPEILLPELTAEQADSLVAEWRERQRSDAFHEFIRTYILADSPAGRSSVPDSVYTRRLRALASPIKLPYNLYLINI